MRCSLNVGPSICRPIGRPELEKPQGIFIPGMPAMLHVTVKTSHRYICNGSPLLAPNSKASSNLSRYDGVQYGHRTARPENLFDLYAASRAEGFGPEVQRRIMLGTYALSSGS